MIQLVTEKIGNPHCVCSANLITIARPDAAIGCADALTSDYCSIGCFVLDKMPRHNDVRSFADHQVLARFDSPGLQTLELFDQHVRFDHDTGSDNIGDLAGQDAGWNVVEFVDLAAANNRVARVRAPLVPNDNIVAGSKQIYELAFRFVSPLKTDYTGRCHKNLFQNR